MRAFIDTSTLIKKYKEESGRTELLNILEDVDEIAVSSVTYVELLCSMQRVSEECGLSKKDMRHFKEAVDIDFSYFFKISLNDALEQAAFKIRQKHTLKSLDLIQLSSALVSQFKLFLTSDQTLYKIAKKVLKGVDVRLVL
jgi:predicted nucleic acid-binding protein